MAAKRGKRVHPSLDIVSSRGTGLAGKRVVLCVAGSVAAYKAIELARLLMRHGADVTCVASAAATKLIRPDYFKWATGNDVVSRLTGELEHVKLADYGKSDLIIVYPGTANTLGKLAAGIDDTPVSTVLTVGLGSGIPMLVCLAMHEAMYGNPSVRKNIEFLEGKVIFLKPRITEGKAKAVEPKDVLDAVLQRFGLSRVLRGKRVLVTAGPTVERIDPVRVITNQSSGETGTLLASELISAGARVTLVYGPGTAKPPAGAKIVRVETGGEMMEAVKSELEKRYDVVVMAAAVSDYAPVRPSKAKIKSGSESLSIRLKKSPKIIDVVKKYRKDALLVGFKAEADVSREALVRSARKKMAESGADMVVANDIGARYRKNRSLSQVHIVGRDRIVSSGRARKEKIAKLIAKEIERSLA